MIRVVQTSSPDHPVYGLTRRGTIGLFVVCALVVTALVLVVVALRDQHATDKRTEALTASNQTLIAGLQGVVDRQHVQLAEARDAYCRLKGYESLSGNAVLRIAIRFKLLSRVEQYAWRTALGRVREIPAASRCSNRPITLRAANAHGVSATNTGDNSTVFSRAPIPQRIVRPRPAPTGRRIRHDMAHHMKPSSPAPVATQTPATIAPPPVLNPAGHAPPGLQPGHKGHNS